MELRSQRLHRIRHQTLIVLFFNAKLLLTGLCRLASANRSCLQLPVTYVEPNNEESIRVSLDTANVHAEVLDGLNGDNSHI